MLKKIHILLVITSCLLIISACQSNSDKTDSTNLLFKVDLVPIDNKTIDVALSIQAQKIKIPADYQFNAKMTLTGPGDVERAELTIKERPALDKWESVRLMNWNGSFEPGQYTLTWGAAGYGSIVTTFEVVVDDNGLLNVKWKDQNETTEAPPAK